jgi:hypothetical protein
VSALDIFAADSRWVRWRLEKRGRKATKVPYSIDGKPAEADKPATWATRDKAIATARRFPNGPEGGIGIELGDLGADSFLAGIDLDTCISDGKFEPWAQTVITRFNSYTEISPGGEGAKVFFLVNADEIPSIRQAMGTEHGRQWKRSARGDHPPGIELYLSNRYFAVTGKHVVETPDSVELVSADTILWLINQAGPAVVGKSPSGNGTDKSHSGKAWFLGNEAVRQGHDFNQFSKTVREDRRTADWYHTKGIANGGRELKRIWQKVTGEMAPDGQEHGISLDDFWAYMPMHSYIFAPNGEMWPTPSVNARIPPIPLPAKQDGEHKSIKAATWLDRNKPVEQMTWSPGSPKIIRDRLISLGGWIERPGVCCFNLYRPPTLRPGDPRQADRWLDHLRIIYPEEAEHIIAFLAHRVQHPEEKINHAMVLGGVPGIGKDTILEPVKHAVGPWNFSEVSPKNILGNTSAFAKSVVLRISEARDLGDFDRFAFFEAMKGYCAAPPDVLRVNEKHIREYYVPNVCGVIITTNHKTDGMHLPADDRRHLVCWSPSVRADFKESYWDQMWQWYANGGIRDVAAYLGQYDLAEFNPKAAPPQTRAFWEIVQSGRAPENAELADIIEKLGNPDVLTISMIVRYADQDFAEWLKDRRNSRRIPHRLEDCGYVAVQNDAANDGLWRVFGKRQAIYGKISLSHQDRLAAATKATKGYAT